MAEADDIKAARAAICHAGLLKVELRGAQNFLLFAPGDALGGLRKPLIAAQPYLDKNQCLLILHDEIDFSELASKVSTDTAQPLTEQKGLGGCFRRLTPGSLSAFDRLHLWRLANSDHG